MCTWRYWFLLLVPAAFAQTSFTVVPGAAVAGGSGTASITISSPSTADPSAVEWTLTYAASVLSSVKLTAGPELTGAGKSLSCASGLGQLRCIAWGANETVIPNGVVATVSFTVAANAPASTALGLAGVTAVSATAKTLTASATGATLLIGTGTTTGAPKLSTLKCAATSILSLGKTVCTVTLTATAVKPASVAVQIALNSDHATVPSSVTIPAGARSGSFTVSVGTVLTVATVPVVVGFSGGELKVYLSLLP